jgi:hypothetical protein
MGDCQYMSNIILAAMIFKKGGTRVNSKVPLLREI